MSAFPSALPPSPVCAVLRELDTPSYVIDVEALARNAAVLHDVKARTGCRILLALKAFSAWRAFPSLNRQLDGTCASSPWEARLGRETFGGETHAFSPAYSERSAREIFSLCDYVVFNSFAQWRRFEPLRREAEGRVSCGLRINPERSTQPVALYDPCAPHSRLGIRAGEFRDLTLDGVDGIHFHTLCEQNADALDLTVQAVEERFGAQLYGLRWLNLGGGHHITRPDYDIDRLCAIVSGLTARYGAVVYLEPGEAVALDAGYLVSTVLDVVDNEGPIAILDCSCAAHMPDVMEMPYRPRVFRIDARTPHPVPMPGGLPGEHAHTCRLAGVSCMAGDVIGDFSFEAPLEPGDRLAFEDMAIYTMVKSSFFNGVRHPSIALLRPSSNKLEVVREFMYEDFKNRVC